MSKEKINKFSGQILDAAIEVHRHLGPALLESVYEVCLCKELNERRIKYSRQVALPVIYKGEELNADFRIEILVED